jgi:branched-chain amino acid transport system ATP-binding protein
MMLALADIRSSYGRIEALKGVSLDVGQGEIVCLIGSNGAGKSTLLRAVSGVQPITAGSISFQGRDITRLSPRARLDLGIAQSPEGRQIFSPLTIEENLVLGATCRPREAAASLERVYALFPVLAERRRSAGGALSGGQQQMLAIGRALMADPKLLLLDEPSLGLSPLFVDKILETIVQLRNEGRTILLVEQNAAAALEISDRAYILKTGTVAQQGASTDLMKDSAVRDSYLG